MTQKYTAKFSGVFTALVTPFDDLGAIDEVAFEKLVLHQVSQGVSGLVIAGSTGEAPTLTIDERIRLLKLAKKHAGQLIVIAGAGSNSTAQAIEMQMVMEGEGADATLSVAPYYNKPTDEGVFAHFSAIAKNTSIPLILYNVPSRTGIDMNVETVRHLFKECENIIGIKDANPNMARFGHLTSIIKSVRPEAVVLSGDDGTFLPALTMGADGVIAVTSHLIAMEMVQLYTAFNEGRISIAQEIARSISGICELMGAYTNPIPVKTILAHLKMIEKNFRLPLTALLPDKEAEFLKKFIYLKGLF